jgi:hypothetical protein
MQSLAVSRCDRDRREGDAKLRRHGRFARGGKEREPGLEPADEHRQRGCNQHESDDDAKQRRHQAARHYSPMLFHEGTKTREDLEEGGKALPARLRGSNRRET